MVRAKSTNTVSPSSPTYAKDSKPVVSHIPSQRGDMDTRWNGADRQALFTAIEKYGAGNWTATAACVPGKTAKQCRDQWMKKLSPQLFKACGSA